VISGSRSRDAWPYCRDLRESMTYILCDSIDAAAAFLRITTHLLIGEAPNYFTDNDDDDDDWTLLRDASLNLKPMDRVWGSPLRGKVSFHPAFLPIITQRWKAAPAASHVYDKETSTS